jgi:hypothetical protein
MPGHADQARALERQMTPDELRRAFAIMEESGWRPGDQPPTWCWIEVFSGIIAARAPSQSKGADVEREAHGLTRLERNARSDDPESVATTRLEG